MDLVSTPPISLSIPYGVVGVYTPSGYAYNYAIASLPFLSAASKDNPIVRSTAPFRKQQFDSSTEPGEQSLDGWWIRSQQSMHGGAGQTYGDPTAGDASFSAIRYYQSKGIDPWTPGEIKLLRRTETVASDPVLTYETDATRAIGILSSGDMYTLDPDGTYTVEPPSESPVLSVTLDGSYYYHTTAASIWRRSYGSAHLTAWTKVWDLAGPRTYAVASWAKERLILASDTGVYELTGVGLTLPSPKWTPPNGAWVPKSITESNSSIYVAGVTSGGKSIILNFTLDSTGSLPDLASGVVVATLPQGEEVTDIYGYLGRFLAISTNLGPRIATISDDGGLEVGPLLFSGATGNWVARGQYLYTPTVMPEWMGNEGGLCRIDLGLEVSSLRFAYASDLYAVEAGSGATAVGLLNGALYLGTADGLYVENLDEYVDSGYLIGSRIRFGTLEPKVYKLLRARGPILESDFYVSVIDPDGDETAVVGYVAGQTPGMEDVALAQLGPLDYLSVKFVLSSSADRMTSAVASGYQLKALPGQPRQRMIRLPLWCFDFELDKHGVMSGYEGAAVDRLLALEDVDRAADTVRLQDLDRNADEIVSIDSMEFIQTSPPDGAGHVGWGGIINLTLRTV